MTLQIDMAADRRSVTVAGHRLEAEQLDELIRRLAVARSELQPAVGFRWSPEAHIDVANNPAMKVGLTADNTVLMALRHTGFGWVCFDFDLQMAKRLTDFITKRLVGVDGPSLEDLPHGDGPKH